MSPALRDDPLASAVRSSASLVESHEGRPDEDRRQPRAPDEPRRRRRDHAGRDDGSLRRGSLDVRAREGQAPSRLGRVRRGVRARCSKTLQADGGAKLRVSSRGRRVSPTMVRLRTLRRAALPARALPHLRAGRTRATSREGGRIAFGQAGRAASTTSPSPKMIVSLDADFLQTEHGSLRATRGFATARRIDRPSDSMSRLYVVEPTRHGHRRQRRSSPAPAGARRRRATRARWPLELATTHGVDLGAVKDALGDGKAPAGVAREVAQGGREGPRREQGQVRRRRRPSAAAARPRPRRTRSTPRSTTSGVTVTYTPVADAVEPADLGADLKALADDMDGGKVDALLILGGNPVYDAPGDVEARREAREGQDQHPPLVAHDETSEHCHLARAAGARARVLGRRPLARRLLVDPAAAHRAALRAAAAPSSCSPSSPTCRRRTSGHELVRDTFRESAATPALLRQRLEHGAQARPRRAERTRCASTRAPPSTTSPTALGKAQAPDRRARPRQPRGRLRAVQQAPRRPSRRTTRGSSSCRTR